MTGAAQQEDMFEELSLAATGTESAAALKQVVSERLAAHRQRRAESRSSSRLLDEAVEAAERQPRARAGSSRVRDAVAARYQNSVTYQEFLTQEAERAEARAAAAIAAQMKLLDELQEQEEPLAGMPVAMSQIEASAASPSRERTNTGAANVFSTGLTVRLYEDLSTVRRETKNEPRATPPVEADDHEATALDAEIAFRRAPEFEPHHPEPTAIAGNLIEFPRQLVAARKARPRLAEGPLREESAPEPQLRIFEVEPEQISDAPADVASAPEWQSILLEGTRLAEAMLPVVPEFQHTPQLETARLELRVMAAVVDACCVGAALLGFATVAVRLAGPALNVLPLPLLGATVGIAGGALFVMYQILFFTLGEATPGMLYARIGLCTFSDNNPTRSAMRRRVLATLLAVVPLGLGIAWAWMDDDGLGWHDRISRMYQRAY